MELFTVYMDERYETECFYVKQLLRICPALRTRVVIKPCQASAAHLAVSIRPGTMVYAMRELTSARIQEELASIISYFGYPNDIVVERGMPMCVVAENWLVNMIVHDMYLQLQLPC